MESFDRVLVNIKKILGKQEFDYNKNMNQLKKQLLQIVRKNAREISK